MVRRLAPPALVALAVLFAPAPADAGLVPAKVSVTPEGKNSLWMYAVVLPAESMLKAGDYFTIYDFAGLIDGSNGQPAGWTFSTQLLGPTPNRLDPDDNPTLMNLTWTYTGPDMSAGQTGLGNFWAASEYGTSGDSFFTAITHLSGGPKTDSNITETVVPVPAPPAVPEPTTLLLAGVGLPLAALTRRVARRAPGRSGVAVDSPGGSA
ncbi:PEP-CTERM sorting domain-containing protein [bacterium]|nr:PEP-CTERM sorting domain-containing protein [bacterium]